jgi:flagellar motor protein MotB
MTRWPLAIVVGSAIGCATAGAPPELIVARQALVRAQDRSVGRYAPYELKRADAALAHAEAIQRERPQSDAAVDEAIAAQRASEKARVAARIAKDLETLDHARRRATRLGVNIVRNEQALRDRERRDREDSAVRAERRRAQIAALAELQGFVGDVRQEADTSTLMLSSRRIFALGAPKLMPGAFERLRSIAHALAAGASYRVHIDVSVNTAGIPGANSYRLAKQRATRIREVLQDCGVPFESLVVTHHAGDASWVRLVVIERSNALAPLRGVAGP